MTSDSTSIRCQANSTLRIASSPLRAAARVWGMGRLGWISDGSFQKASVHGTESSIWLWLKIKEDGLRGFWSMFPLTRVPFWNSVFFEPQPFRGGGSFQEIALVISGRFALIGDEHLPQARTVQPH